MMYIVTINVWDKGAKEPHEVKITVPGDTPESAAEDATRTVIATYDPDTIEVKNVSGSYLINRTPYPISGNVVRW